MTRRPGWAEKAIEKARRLKAPDDTFARLPDEHVLKLLKAEHRHALRVVRKLETAGLEKLSADCTRCYLEGVRAAYAALQRGRT